MCVERQMESEVIKTCSMRKKKNCTHRNTPIGSECFYVLVRLQSDFVVVSDLWSNNLWWDKHTLPTQWLGFPACLVHHVIAYSTGCSQVVIHPCLSTNCARRCLSAVMGTGVSSLIGCRVEIVVTQSTSKARGNCCLYTESVMYVDLVKQNDRMHWSSYFGSCPGVKYTCVGLVCQLHRICDWRRKMGFRKSRRDTGKKKGAHLLFWRKAYSWYYLWFFFLTWMLLCCFSLFHFCSRN